MASGALFSNNTARGPSKNLVELKAGKMTIKGKTVYPDSRKGLLYVYQSDDALMHFCWKDRASGAIEDDLIIFPDDCEFKHVPECKTGRVYLLKFKLSNKKFFFWLQDVKGEKDEEHCRKINEYLNNPPTPHRSSDITREGDLQNLLNNMSQQQLMQLFGGVGQMGLGNLLGMRERPHNSRTSTTTPSTPVTTSATRPPASQTPAPTTVTPSETPRSSSGGKSSGTKAPSSASTNLLGRTPTLMDDSHLFDLQGHLWNFPMPPSANQSGQGAPMVRQFGLGPDAVNAAATGNLEEFVTALETEAKKDQDQSSASTASSNQPEDDSAKDTSKTPAKKDDSKDDEMALD
ncbi:proteasomal ubiquitin receptor ADRM1 homolog isoform X2 [Microplitis mediator]|uniref:proteasomal ubiquitin receptor ADRM1 homolog isoform X2 n=1 Tax=Microplitis mediator TaxID=375433 RepID=UPI0025524B05|nr:proteasomal ubiquitin receptor ADRM1 homolog isoform X2 [Microplitis mediator]